MSKREAKKELTVSVRATLPELTPAELRLVVGGIPGVVAPAAAPATATDHQNTIEQRGRRER